MGMYYYISANVETNCKDYFPDGLSYFFDQIGGYGEKSMVSQVERILDIDLSTFQLFDFVENEKPDSIYWKDIDEFERLIDVFIEKIEKNIDYYKKVKYHSISYSEYNFSTNSMEKMMDVMKKVQNHPMHGYPNDNGYLNEGRIKKDLKKLKSILLCYKESGATKIKLDYN